ncbi:Rpn family recombination-promoting nuclease/putative transposase [Bacteroides ovatus]|jgi:predicted transposase/invertase (TIGR01784 family)|uniref:Rpn family recombination-promoting nuclease/putative transposase n=1 Tax=Bacteroides ovatus TaxID=28116 RepID=A0A9P3ZWG0_BACOV|nr:Rpn family recombination-promoting nuclease/putative transposase [Bacteroides ovatus]KAA3922229.1 Rpn family recombination-promoting nuclease/putative transposase [Bacteroides ovatus]KAA3927262.1 Rpn family recombination-promoting nuclease/putative transposase [Bacteroides ovatus]KAA3971091.1 Rpn family recombination-promoting nuclease/putative transposase [Bacteroides ovatus]MCS2454624.1 Rpn family recombination-promoting nuclease/putative transposase [Bacteroides ovatus]MCS2503466.1 Rpn f
MNIRYPLYEGVYRILTTDYGFKLIFGREVSKDLLIEFLNDLLEGERVITDLQFLNNEQLPLYPEGRGIIYDVYCTTDTGEKIIVEMQNRMQSNFKERSIYYLSRAIINQGRVGNEWKFEIKAVYGVFLMNFIIDKNIKLRTDVILSDRETGELFSDKFREIFIALPLFNKNEEECETNFERWIYILNNMETLKRMPFKARKAVFEKLEDIADVASMSPEDRERYDNSVKVYRDYLVTMDAAEQKGIKEGLEKGIEKGMKEGTQRAQLKIARNMKAKGIDNESIAECTDLPLSIIEGL